MENAFRDGEIKTVGTDIDKLMPPISRFGGGGRTKKKQNVCFDRYVPVQGSIGDEDTEYKLEIAMVSDAMQPDDILHNYTGILLSPDIVM